MCWCSAAAAATPWRSPTWRCSNASPRIGWAGIAAVLITALMVMLVALAGPQALGKVPRHRGVVMLVIDVSLSMQATDVAPTRLAAAQAAAQAFTDQLPSGINLGLESFAGYAAALVAPSPDREPVRQAITGLKLDAYTATGEAIFTALAALQAFSRTWAGSDDADPAPAQIVLESDGEQTVPGGPDAESQPRGAFTAARAAAQAHIPVSTISFGTDYGTVQLDSNQPPVPVPVDAGRAPARRLLGRHRGRAGRGPAGGQRGSPAATRLRCCAGRWPRCRPGPGRGGSGCAPTLARRTSRPRRLFTGIEFAIGARRIAPLWRLLDGLGEADWTDAIDMPAAQVAVASYCPNWWPTATRLLIRRVRLDVTAGQVSADPRARRRRTLHPDQRALPLPELTALAATEPIYGYSFIVTNLDALPTRQPRTWSTGTATAPRWRTCSFSEGSGPCRMTSHEPGDLAGGAVILRGCCARRW